MSAAGLRAHVVSVSDTVHIDAPRSAVFEYLDDPHNHVEVTPSLVDVENVEPLDIGGNGAEFAYSIAGVELDGTLVETTHHPDGRMVFELRGQLPGEIEITFADADGGTRVTYAAEYEIPGTVLSRVAEPFVRRYNERELRTLLENLRTRLEDT